MNLEKKLFYRKVVFIFLEITVFIFPRSINIALQEAFTLVPIMLTIDTIKDMIGNILKKVLLILN